MKRASAAVFAAIVIMGVALGGEGLVIEDFEGDAGGRVRVQEGVEGSVEAVVEKSEGGGYLALKFARAEKSGYAYARLAVTGVLGEKGGEYDGLRFKVKGDGSETFGLIEIRSDEYVNIFQGVFSLASREWSEVEIRWDEFFQVNDGTQEAAINWKDLNVFAFGSRATWGPCAFAVDDVELAKLPAKEKMKAPAGVATLERTGEILKSGGEVKLVALGDSITWGAQVSRDRRWEALYFERVAGGLEAAFAGAKVAAVNAGVGGDTIGEAIVRTGHQVAAENPDIVLVLLGANDALYEFTEGRVRQTMGILIDKLIETTDADIVLLGPTPILDKPGAPERYAKVYEELAREKRVAYMDLGHVMTLLAEDDYRRAFGDNVHLSEYGHEVIGKAVLAHLLATLK